MNPTREEQIWMYRTMVTSRRFDEAIGEIYMEGKQPKFDFAKGPLPGEMHRSDGQEPVAVGVCAHLTAQDVVTGSHRPHHEAIAKGVDLNKMAAEIFGKKTGLSSGMGGHMHLIDAEVNFSCSGIIGQGLGPAVGAALSRSIQGKPGVAVNFIGDGGANEGAWHEAMNLAAVWKLPFISVIEDNGWGISTPKSAATSVENHSVRAASYGVPGYHVKGNDPYEIYRVAGEAIARARAGEGPSLIVVETYRLQGHFVGDDFSYMPEGELDSQRAKDPIPAMRRKLIADGVATTDELDRIEADCAAKAEQAITFAVESEYPTSQFARDIVFAA
ncbi:thiamine pyrophosphate-dependent dehydrogenase E1 component subunit alpha [Microbulbifer sp. S227A]|uniref:thiamine pyrophosphate-dependent dehydrogenase E1 component subunit alpha n=1 Tax=Microbulbifer sp. S227A TaxID=3415131 RepID=UPI003C7DF5BD